MPIRNYSSIGFVIARKNVKEGDRILILFTKDFGKISVIAKGARKIKSRKRGSIEMFNLIKFSATKSHGLDIITEVEVLDSFDKLRNSLNKISVAYYFCEVIGRVTQEDQKHSEIYEILKNYFSKLLITNKLKDLRLKFIEETLISLGFWPQNKKIINQDLVLESIIERKINSVRVGKRMLQR